MQIEDLERRFSGCAEKILFELQNCKQQCSKQEDSSSRNVRFCNACIPSITAFARRGGEGLKGVYSDSVISVLARCK